MVVFNGDRANHRLHLHRSNGVKRLRRRLNDKNCRRPNLSGMSCCCCWNNHATTKMTMTTTVVHCRVRLPMTPM